MNYSIIHNHERKRFEVLLDEHLAVVDYKLKGKVITYERTSVPRELEGRGVGSALAVFALEYAASQHLRVVAHCPFVRAYIERHPDYQSLLA